MKKLLKTVIILISLFFLICMSACNRSTSYEHDIQIKKNIHDSLSIYPTKNLEDLYDIKGSRDSDFAKEDKGTWVVDTSINKNTKYSLHSEGAMLFINRNKKESKGYYYISDYKEKDQDTEKRYPVIFKNNKIHPINSNISKQVKNKIEQFQFLIQYTDINENIEKKRGKYFYNPNVSNFKGRYNLNEQDEILKAVKTQYNLDYDQADLLIKGSQEPSTKGISNKSIQISFNNNYYITDDLIYKPNKKDESE